ncbi:unnamed protein product, partial [Arctogadus glacialis]
TSESDPLQPAGLHVGLQPQQVQRHQQDPPDHAQLLRGQQRPPLPLAAVLREDHHRPQGQEHAQRHRQGHA